MKYAVLAVGRLLEFVTQVVLLIGWLMGFVLAKGFWSTLFCVIPFYAWYLVLEKVMTYHSWN